MLTPQEKQAGRDFRDAMAARLEQSFVDDPPTYTVPNVLAFFRHICPSRRGQSTALELKEIYHFSPAFPEFGIPAGRFGYIYRAGRCRGCGETARSRDGRLVEGQHRPPLAGRVARS